MRCAYYLSRGWFDEDFAWSGCNSRLSDAFHVPIHNNVVCISTPVCLRCSTQTLQSRYLAVSKACFIVVQTNSHNAHENFRALIFSPFLLWDHCFVRVRVCAHLIISQFGHKYPAFIRKTAPETLDIKGKLTINGETLEILMQAAIKKTLAGQSGNVIML